MSVIEILHSLVSEQPTHLLFISDGQTVLCPFFDDEHTISWHSVSDTMFYCNSYYDLVTIQRITAKMVFLPGISFYVMQIATPVM